MNRTSYIVNRTSTAFLLLVFFHAAAPIVPFPDQAPGEISFTGNAGSDNVFTVERWKFTEVANVGEPEHIRVRAELDMTSLRTGWAELLKNLKKKKDYFYVKKYATATIAIDGAQAIGEGQYRTAALLSLKGVTKPVPLTFTLTESDDGTFHVDAWGEINRREFNFTGGGPKDVVPVTVSAELVTAE